MTVSSAHQGLIGAMKCRQGSLTWQTAGLPARHAETAARAMDGERGPWLATAQRICGS